MLYLVLLQSILFGTNNAKNKSPADKKGPVNDNIKQKKICEKENKSKQKSFLKITENKRNQNKYIDLYMYIIEKETCITHLYQEEHERLRFYIMKS